jgi:HAD superfamily hydrolase (TIGR01509 family)
MALIIDLDQTIINSQIAAPSRKARDWNTVYRMIPQLEPYPGIQKLLSNLYIKGIPIGIVTSSPSSYCHKVISHYQWKISATVCYHDTKKHKPHPEPILMVLEKLGVAADQAIAVGDAAADILAARGAGVFSVGATWGTLEKEELLLAKPDAICNNVDELETIIWEKFG